ncbi:MAG: IS1380 family transposase [Spirulinaceae cyanobacterium RM2_2_10]|nr:IS1380 family transposase [Spirulinaceae cyanobacterium RM2_2_10]
MEIAAVKTSKKSVRRKARKMPELRFEDQRLTSFAGLVLFQALFSRLQLRERLRQCFRHLKLHTIYESAGLMLMLIVHLLLGYRQLRDLRFYEDDPMVQRLLGLKQLPNVATLSRWLKKLDAKAISRLCELMRTLVLQRLAGMQLRRITLDFDGSTLGTQRKAEGTAIGYNKKKKGQRSYYPLFCTIAQTGQVFDFLHRPGNVHDSKGAREFILACIEWIRASLPGVLIEVRMDSAFFSDAIVSLLHEQDVAFTLSVPFDRFVELKQRVETRSRWEALDAESHYFEIDWKPKCWSLKFRLLAIRKKTYERQRGPLQLDIFVPKQTGYEFKVIVTNKTVKARHVTAFHNGRGAQEGVFAELKSEGQMDYIPVRGLHGNKAYMIAAILAHNLNREMQMQTRPKLRATGPKRPPLWSFERLRTFRRIFLQRAGRLTRPQGQLTLTLSANEAVKEQILETLHELQAA